MPETDIEQTDKSDLTNEIVDFSVATETTDAPTGQTEFRWQIEDWSQNLGYYKKIPELQTAIDAKANWTIGAGIETDEQTEALLNSIKGHGKDSFNTILANQIRTYTIGGDSFAEIILDEEDILLNLKPLDPSSMVIISNKQGRIIRYEQITKVRDKKSVQKFQPEQIFHLSRKRVADEVHGISIIPSVEWIILARNEAMNDWKRVLHRNVEPLFIYHLDTDDTDKINDIKTKYNAARKDGENLFVPKGTVEPEVVSVAGNAILNPLNWINQLNDYFFQAVNVPQIIIGNAKEFTDASGKIVYLSYEQSVKGEQLYIEEQVLSQLNVEIKLTFPASLQNELISDTPSMELEEEPQEQAVQPNDTTEEIEGKE